MRLSTEKANELIGNAKQFRKFLQDVIEANRSGVSYHIESLVYGEHTWKTCSISVPSLGREYRVVYDPLEWWAVTDGKRLLSAWNTKEGAEEHLRDYDQLAGYRVAHITEAIE